MSSARGRLGLRLAFGNDRRVAPVASLVSAPMKASGIPGAFVVSGVVVISRGSYLGVISGCHKMTFQTTLIVLVSDGMA